MEQFTRAAALDARTRAFIRNTAQRLARTGNLPGMDADDIEQDLFLDLWRRRGAFDPTKASFPTFVDRVVAHRVATLTYPTARLKAERRHAWIDAPIEEDDGAATLADTLADPTAPTDISHGLALDMRRFVEGLTPALRRCCEILLVPNLKEAAAIAGLHRSSVYENMHRLRRMAAHAGLQEYLGATPTFCGPRR